MSLEDYRKAYKLGKKDYQTRMMHGQRPILDALENILPAGEVHSMVPLGLIQIPIDQIAGTMTEGRSNVFSGNFMPILSENSEFAQKWINLSTAHTEEGIREPVKAYEYMNKFYIEEGNKRVSVMKYFQAVSIPGNVTRIMPKRTEEKENKIYFEFLDFYKVTKINFIWFSKEGSFARLLKIVGKDPEEAWTDDERMDFNSLYNRFTTVYEAKGGNALTSITPGDAFLSFIKLYGYQELLSKTSNEIKELVTKSWQEFRMLSQGEEVELKMNPVPEKKLTLSRLLPLNTAQLKSTKLKIAFIYEKTITSSAWTYSHELGRLHLEQMFPDEVSTIYFDNVTEQNVDECIEKAIEEGCDIIFTTTPIFASASVKAAIAHPNVKILNCSLNTSHRYIRTYYARMHEAKFLMGAIAGAMAENDNLTYITDYPVFGNIANINAFALGAKMINPRVKVHLEWSTLKDYDVTESIQRTHPDCVSARDIVIPEDASRYFGIYHMDNGRPRNLAMPLCHWGKFYERLIRTIMDGTWKHDDNTAKAINYWWGMSAGVVDVICSKNLPVGTKRLVELLKNTITAGEFNPFAGVLYSQTGIIEGNPDGVLTPEEIMKMDWLAENVIGFIPKEEDLREHAQPVVSQQGLQAK